MPTLPPSPLWRAEPEAVPEAVVAAPPFPQAVRAVRVRAVTRVSPNSLAVKFVFITFISLKMSGLYELPVPGQRWLRTRRAGNFPSLFVLHPKNTGPCSRKPGSREKTFLFFPVSRRHPRRLRHRLCRHPCRRHRHPRRRPPGPHSRSPRHSRGRRTCPCSRSPRRNWGRSPYPRSR